MKREQLEYLIRAAGGITGSRRLIVIGSQAILAQHPYDSPEGAIVSREADMIPIDAPETTDAINGVLGELSAFDATFGYHADGVDLKTAVLPSDWQERLVAIDNPNTNGYIGLCLEVHDLLLSKYFANREKDREFCRVVVRASLVERSILLQRLSAMEIAQPERARIAQQIAADFDF